MSFLSVACNLAHFLHYFLFSFLLKMTRFFSQLNVQAMKSFCHLLTLTFCLNLEGFSSSPLSSSFPTKRKFDIRSSDAG